MAISKDNGRIITTVSKDFKNILEKEAEKKNISLSKHIADILKQSRKR